MLIIKLVKLFFSIIQDISFIIITLNLFLLSSINLFKSNKSLSDKIDLVNNIEFSLIILNRLSSSYKLIDKFNAS